MFEEICLVCGKALLDDGRAYCSDDCQNADVTSPSISSASSAWSSPHLESTIGGDVPALVPSALGSALHSYRGRERYSISSSSVSSASWSAVADDDGDDNAVVSAEDEHGCLPDPSDAHSSICEGGSRSLGNLSAQKSSGLSYARRPATTNTRSTVPLLHRRTSSGSGPNHTSGVPQSAPSIHSSVDDDDYDDYATTITREHPHPASYREKTASTITSKSKRSRNRASLPAYFSLLQISSPTHKISPISSSSGRTVVRSSPPTPKLALVSGPTSGLPAEPMLTTSVIYTGGIEATPRGRRREPGTSRASRRSQHSRSASRSRPPASQLVNQTRERLNSRSSVEQVFDWSSAPVPPRGRPAVRRNSSPLPKMLLATAALEEHAGAEKRAGTRGRMRAEELDFVAPDAPGYGSGRSGLKDRDREAGRGWW